MPETAVRRGRACPARGFAMPLINGQPPPTAKGAGCRPPSPLSSATRPRHPVGAGHARPAALRQLPVSFCIPFIFYIVGRGCGVANRGVSNVCPCGANNRTSVFAKQTGGARCAPPSVDPSAASRQIPSMFRPQGKIHPPPSTSRRRDPTHKTASPFRIPHRKGLAY